MKRDESPATWRKLAERFRQLKRLDATWSNVDGWDFEPGSEVETCKVFKDAAGQAALAKGLGGDWQAWLFVLRNETDKYRDELQDMEVSCWDGEIREVKSGRIDDVCTASADHCDLQAKFIEATDIPLIRNLRRLKKECGWTFDDFAKVLEIDRRTVLRHFNGAEPRPDTLASYAQAFSQKLGRTITVEELLTD